MQGLFKSKTAVKRFAVLIAAAALLGVALYWYAGSATEVKVPVFFEVKKGDLTVKISELGELMLLSI